MAQRTDDLSLLSDEARRLAAATLDDEARRADGAFPTASGAVPTGLPGFIDREEPMPGGGVAEGGHARLPEGGVIERVEERAVFGKRRRDAGGIRVSTRTKTVTETLRDTVTDLAVEIERVPVGRFVEAAEGPRTEGETTVLPVYEERLVVERRLFLVEEVHLRRVPRPRAVEEPVALRKQAAHVERLPPLDDTQPHLGVTSMMDDTFRGSRTLTAMFDTAAEAERAASRLRSAGVPDGAIRLTQGSGAGYTGDVDYADTTYRDQHKGFWDSLADFFFPSEDRYAYAEGLARGSHMVTVTNFDAGLYDTVVDILDDEGSVDLESRESEWKSSGWNDYRTSDYYDESRDISGTGGMRGASSGLSGAAAGVGAAVGGAMDRAGDALARGADRVGDALTGDSSTRGTIYDDGMGDRNLQMAADEGRRSQADFGSQQAGYAASGSMRQPTGYRDDDLGDEGTVKVVDEELAVGKRAVDRGSVRVRSYVREEPVSADVDLRSERVHVERRAVDRPVGAGDLDLRDQMIEARETVEEPVVSKDARVVEEIGLRRETEVDHRTIQDTVRKTEVEIEDTRTGQSSRITGDGTDRDRDRF